MNNGVAKRHDIENFTVLIADFVEEAQGVDLVLLRRLIEGDADALEYFGFGYIEADEVDGRLRQTAFAVAFEVEVIHRHAEITRTWAQSCSGRQGRDQKKGPAGERTMESELRLQSTV